MPPKNTPRILHTPPLHPTRESAARPGAGLRTSQAKLAACLFLLLAHTAKAQIAIRTSATAPTESIAISNTPVVNGNFAWFNTSSTSSRSLGQTFTATSSITSPQISITLQISGAQAGANGAPFTLSLLTFPDAVTPTPSSTVWTAKGTLPTNISSLANQYITFYLPATTFTAGAVYGFLLSFDNPAASEQVNFNLHGGNTYSGGLNVYTSSGTTYQSSGNDLNFIIQNAYQWKNVALSGASAMVTGVFASPSVSSLVYIRTDVGGIYRWSQTGSKWIPLTDNFPLDWAEYYACESLALDPSNANILYYAGGYSHGNPGALLKTTDQGATWTKLTVSSTLNINGTINGGGDRRWAGERLAVSPFNSNIVLFGSRLTGLWRSTDAGSSWAKVATIPVSADNYGVQCIAFDPSTSGKVYAGVSGNGVYMSTDSGATWSSIGGSTLPRRMKIGSNGVLWYTTQTSIAKYSGGAWTNYTPTGGTGEFCGLAVNPSNPLDVVVQQGGQAVAMGTLWRSTNGGGSWSSMPVPGLISTATWANPPWRFSPADLAFDPFSTSQMWGGHWHSANINSSTEWWVQKENGHEEDVILCLATPPTGYELLEGSADDDGFAWTGTSLDTFPSDSLGIAGDWTCNTKSIAYCESDPTKMLRLSSQKWYGGTGLRVAKSSDGGATWNRITSFPGNLFPLVCAISPGNANNSVVICSYYYSTDSTGATWVPSPATNPWKYTVDGGTTWQTIAGLPSPPQVTPPFSPVQVLAADHVIGAFYYLDTSGAYSVTTGKIYRSADGGASFSQVNSTSLLPSGMGTYSIKTLPGTAGDVWVSVDKGALAARDPNEGLYRSTDGGATFQKLSSATRAFSFGFGKPATGSTTPTLYLYGRANSDTSESVYRSPDLGATWVNISDPNQRLSDWPMYLEGSRQTYGRVFVGTMGRGVFYCSKP